MKMDVNKLAGDLKKTLRRCYLITSDETFLNQQARDLVVTKAQKLGFNEHKKYTVEKGFKWDEIFHQTQSGSLFADKTSASLLLPYCVHCAMHL